VTEKYILGMRILLMGYEHALRTLKAAKNGNGAGIAEFQDDFRRMAARCWNSGSQWTLRWREMDSNFRFRCVRRS
jgi:hypothetical protein